MSNQCKVNVLFKANDFITNNQNVEVINNDK